jgi:hypothetical protein
MLSFILLALLWIVPLSVIVGVLDSLTSHKNRLLSRDWWLEDVKEKTGVWAFVFIVVLFLYIVAKKLVSPEYGGRNVS